LSPTDTYAWSAYAAYDGACDTDGVFTIDDITHDAYSDEISIGYYPLAQLSLQRDIPGEGVVELPDEGTLVFSLVTPETVTPEPGTAVLWLTGIGLMIVMMRKRSAQGLPQAR
jgi:hypothetical protein